MAVGRCTGSIVIKGESLYVLLQDILIKLSADDELFLYARVYWCQSSIDLMLLDLGPLFGNIFNALIVASAVAPGIELATRDHQAL